MSGPSCLGGRPPPDVENNDRLHPYERGPHANGNSVGGAFYDDSFAATKAAQRRRRVAFITTAAGLSLGIVLVALVAWLGVQVRQARGALKKLQVRTLPTQLHTTQPRLPDCLSRAGSGGALLLS